MAKVLPGNETVVRVPAIEINGVPHLIGETEVAPIDSTAIIDILNYWQAITKPSLLTGGVGGNVSCALMDSLNLAQTDSDTDGDRTICSVGQSEALTFYNFDAEFSGLRDEDVHGDGVFNLFRDITRAPDVPFIDVHRIGAKQTTPFSVNDEVDMYYSWTDNPVPSYGDGANMTIDSTQIPKNIIHVGAKLTA